MRKLINNIPNSKLLFKCMITWILQSEELNAHGALYVKRHPQLKIRVVDGSSLAVAVVLNNIPKGATQVLLRGKLTKVAYEVVSALCQKGIKVISF